MCDNIRAAAEILNFRPHTIKDVLKCFFKHGDMIPFLELGRVDQPELRRSFLLPCIYGQLTGDLGSHFDDRVLVQHVQHGGDGVGRCQRRLGHALHHNGLSVISGLEGERDVQLSGRFCRGVRIQNVPDHGSHLIVCALHDRATSHFEDRFLLTFIHRFSLLSCVIRVPALCRTPAANRCQKSAGPAQREVIERPGRRPAESRIFQLSKCNISTWRRFPTEPTGSRDAQKGVSASTRLAIIRRGTIIKRSFRGTAPLLERQTPPQPRGSQSRYRYGDP
nr:MAG TPA: hypothetical protein [Caudoviricetes sp.]